MPRNVDVRMRIGVEKDYAYVRAGLAEDNLRKILESFGPFDSVTVGSRVLVI